MTADNQSRGYGDANPVLTASFAGFKNGETLATSGVTGSPNLTTTATSSSAPGTFPIAAAPGTLASANYTFTLVNGTLTVNKATLTVTADDKSRGYGDANPTFSATFSGFKNGDTLASVTGSASFATTATGSSVAGTYPITVAAGTLSSANYTFAFVPGTLTISKAALSVVADNQLRGYGDANPTLTVTYSGFKNGDTFPTSVTGAPSVTLSLIHI